MLYVFWGLATLESGDINYSQPSLSSGNFSAYCFPGVLIPTAWGFTPHIHKPVFRQILGSCLYRQLQLPLSPSTPHSYFLLSALSPASANGFSFHKLQSLSPLVSNNSWAPFRFLPSCSAPWKVPPSILLGYQGAHLICFPTLKVHGPTSSSVQCSKSSCFIYFVQFFFFFNVFNLRAVLNLLLSVG